MLLLLLQDIMWLEASCPPVNNLLFSVHFHEDQMSESKRSERAEEETRSLTGYGCVQSEGLQAGELFAPGLLHAVTEDVLPGVELQQLDASQQLVGLL